MTRPRILVRGGTYAVTRRTVLRKAFVGAWSPEVNAAFLYAAARAQQKTGIELNWLVLMPNHLHICATTVDKNLHVFVRELNRDFAKALNVLMQETGYEPPGAIWDSEKGHWTRLLTPEAMAERCLYDMCNPVAAGLVGRPEQSPMVNLGYGEWSSGMHGAGVRVIRRPGFYFSAKHPQELPLTLVPPGGLLRSAGGDVQKLVPMMHGAMDAQCRAWKKWRGGRRVRGAAEVKLIHAYNEPTTPRPAGPKKIPRWATGNCENRAELVELARGEERGFYGTHREGVEQRRQGVDAEMPPGTLYEVLYRHAREIEPDPHAVLCAPGMTAAEVQADGESFLADVLRRAKANIAEVRGGIDPKECELRFDEPRAVVGASVGASVDAGEALPVEVMEGSSPRWRHRLPEDGKPRSSRQVVLRGRGQAKSGDPPG